MRRRTRRVCAARHVQAMRNGACIRPPTPGERERIGGTGETRDHTETRSAAEDAPGGRRSGCRRVFDPISFEPPLRSVVGVTDGNASTSRDLRAEFSRHYSFATELPLRRAEERVIGADYGATSYTTRGQADRIAALLDLGPDHHLLDLGCGTGWPGIYLAATTGCTVMLTDIPMEGLRVAAARLRHDEVDGTVVAASADALPFRDGTFDAATSSDVFC